MKAVIFIHVLYLILIRTFTVKGVTKCESKVELRAVLLSCSAKESGCDDDDPLSQAMKSEESQILQADSKNFDSLREEKERGFPNAVKDCKRKLLITLKIKNVGKIPCDDEYIVVDHVFDPVTGGRGRLLTPVVLKLRQEQMIQLYGLQFQRVVSGDPYEEQKTSGKTCSIDPENPTCGIALYDGKPIPFSEGFCCSVDSHLNEKRQLPPAPHGDSFLFGDSKLVPEENARFASEEKPSFIVNPKLVKMRSGGRDEESRDNKGSSCGGIGDPLSWDKMPNYLLELDRKIVCDKGDFMNELSKLRDDKNEVETSSDAYRGPEVPIGVGNNSGRIAEGAGVTDANLDQPELTTVAIDVDVSDDDSLSENQANVILLKNVIKALNQDQMTTRDPTFDYYGPVKASRGKRENKKENKKMTLEEKLEKFASSKKHLTNRRKRLLELSHKRFRKSNERCSLGNDCQTMMIPDDYVRSPPPKYFFSHDRLIIDPLEPHSMDMNTTCKPMKDLNYDEDLSKDLYEPSMKTDLLRDMKDEKEDKILDPDFYQRPDKGYKMKGKDRFGGKKGRISHNELGRMENGIGRGKMKETNIEDSLKGTSSLSGDKKFNLYKEAEEDKQEEEKEKKEETEMTGSAHSKDQKNRLNSKTIKNLFHKNECDKKGAKPKIRNFFMAKNREREKLKSEVVKGHRKTELSHKDKEGFESKKLRFKGRQDMDNQDSEEKQFKDLDKESKPEKDFLKETLENQDNLKTSEGYPENLESNPEKNPFNKDLEKDKETPDEDTKFQKQNTEEKPNAGPFPPTDEIVGDVDFNVEIIRNKFPDSFKRRFHPSSAEQFVKSRVDASAQAFETKVYDLTGRPKHLQDMQNALLNYESPQRYYILESDKLASPNVFVVQSDKNHYGDAKNRQRFLQRSDMSQFNPGELSSRGHASFNSYGHKKPYRHYYLPVSEYKENEPNLPRQRQTYLGKHEDKLHESQLRGKRFSEMRRRYEDGYRRIGHRPQTFEGGSHSKVRKKRSASYSFQPARGFCRSEFEAQQPDEELVHELTTCMAEQRREDNTWARKLAAMQIPRLKRENHSIDANIISSLQQLQSRYNLPVVSAKLEKTIRTVFDKQRLMQSYLNAPDYVLEEIEASLKKKRQTKEQSQNDQSKPPENSQENGPSSEDTLAGEYTQETARCMRFGDLWYSLYMIKKPMISQSVGVQMFEKHSLCDGSSQWRDLTKGTMVRIGTFLPKAEDDLPTISMSFVGGKTEKIQSAIDPDSYFLLIPSHVSDPAKVNLYPQFDAGPEEYMLVPTKDVSSGGECNMVGTSFEAFARRPDRCTQRLGSCLKRQPVDLWREDMEARIRNKRGKYFVENFGTVPNSSIKTYTNLTGEFLALEYYGEYTSTIEIEVKADSNAIIRKGSNAQIPLVYIDSTYPKKTRIVLSVLNIGLTSSYFRPRLGDCPPDLDPAWCPLEGPLVTIPPQQRHDFKLDLSGTLPNGHIYVSVQILNQVNKKIATRKITIKKGDRCVCAFHCKCNCLGNTASGRTCDRLSLEDYRKAGYIGSFPFRGGAAASPAKSIWQNIHIVFITASYVLLFLGVMKGILGIFIRRIGISGVRVITGPRELCGYYESELQGCSVLYDECGFPIHPTTCQPVQIVPLWTETIINFFFFFLYPLRGIWFLILSLPCCRSVCTDIEGLCQQDDGDADQKCSSPLLANKTHPTCVHYNMTTVNSKKWKEDEFLPYPAYRGDDDPLEEDDTEFVLQEMKRYRKK